ncbi:hypothetical protein TIFTF001_027942 [Ficus carica]|uniref:Uncharacterized protein n=1 Tax=Ficus carica TaxID=3494 RepID=A0AA88J0U4_FICCA|nr:hypothetical protein TIFTF001_027942 [Ficus carica]
MDKNNTTTTNLYSINENIRPTSTDNHHEEAAGVVPVNKSWRESLLLVDDSMISTNTSVDGIFPNYIASCTSTGNLDLHAEPSSNYNNNNTNNNTIANFLSQELADDHQPAAALMGTNSADFVEDHHPINYNGHQSCWTDFLMDMDLWDLDQGN